MRKYLYWACAGLLLFALGQQSSGYYTLLRLVVTAGAVFASIDLYDFKPKMYFLLFVGIGVLFNPIFPIYLHDKGAWMPWDIIAGVSFAAKAFLPNIFKD